LAPIDCLRNGLPSPDVYDAALWTSIAPLVMVVANAQMIDVPDFTADQGKPINRWMLLEGGNTKVIRRRHRRAEYNRRSRRAKQYDC
jgi:hypothetical protein